MPSRNAQLTDRELDSGYGYSVAQLLHIAGNFSIFKIAVTFVISGMV